MTETHARFTALDADLLFVKARLLALGFGVRIYRVQASGLLVFGPWGSCRVDVSGCLVVGLVYV